MKASAESSGSGWAAAFACWAIPILQSDPMAANMSENLLVMTDHEPLDSLVQTDSQKSQTIGIAWRANRWVGHCMSSFQPHKLFARSATRSKFKLRQVCTAAASSLSCSEANFAPAWLIRR